MKNKNRFYHRFRCWPRALKLQQTYGLCAKFLNVNERMRSCEPELEKYFRYQ